MAAAYERLQKLGEEKFRHILNALLQGTAAMAMARVIQHEWGEFQDVAEKTLTQQLNRLRHDVSEGLYGKELARKIDQGLQPHVKLLEGVSVSVLERMEELARWQRERAQSLKVKEKIMPLPTKEMLATANAVFTDYSKLLQDIQKMRYDMGLDPFHGVVSGMRGSSTSITLPNGTNVQQQVFEAMTTVEKILTNRGIE